MKKKLFKISLSLLGVLFILALSATWYIYKYPDFRHQQYVKDYLRENSDLSQEVIAAIKNGKVIIGMYPDEAYAAAGAFIYSVQSDPNYWEDNVFPPKVIFSQKERPDNSKIEMRFGNKTQFDTKERTSFTVCFKRGKAIKIERKK